MSEINGRELLTFTALIIKKTFIRNKPQKYQFFLCVIICLLWNITLDGFSQILRQWKLSLLFLFARIFVCFHAHQIFLKNIGYKQLGIDKKVFQQAVCCCSFRDILKHIKMDVLFWLLSSHYLFLYQLSLLQLPM